MANSNTDAGNWIEIYNDSSVASVDLGDLMIEVSGGFGFPSLPVVPGDLLGVNLDPLQFLIVVDTMGGSLSQFHNYWGPAASNTVILGANFFTPLQFYDPLTISVIQGSTVTDQIDMATADWPTIEPNQSIYVDPTKLDENHIGSNWSVSQFPYLPSGASPPSEAQAGTPGSFAAMVPEPSTLITFCCLSLTSCLRRRRHR
ncbi:lamin tail domain-containing protein [Roseiconus lacunae]|uniref:lamin tail domain-containing protein n=1 Tax=Roseiconus lacunae TaxID=2605694 RepID=UPI0011F17743|nr:lamin tail domain-containing protein [Roseiconus lacunae]WRQ49173.1 hypothetical protein U8335_19705 [Stieleria sp. HD01]